MQRPLAFLSSLTAAESGPRGFLSLPPQWRLAFALLALDAIGARRRRVGRAQLTCLQARVEGAVLEDRPGCQLRQGVRDAQLAPVGDSNGQAIADVGHQARHEEVDGLAVVDVGQARVGVHAGATSVESRHVGLGAAQLFAGCEVQPDVVVIARVREAGDERSLEIVPLHARIIDAQLSAVRSSKGFEMKPLISVSGQVRLSSCHPFRCE
eukprot:2346756-Rhodomonas_salina.1